MSLLTTWASYMQGAFTNTLAFLFVVTVIVFFHELGHFLVARWCGVTVETFSIGFGPEIWSFYDRHGTQWRVAWIPLGGYVKFVGDENAASAPSRETLLRLPPERRTGAFHLKPVWQKALVIAAGPGANFLLAIVIFSLLFAFVGARNTPPRIGTVEQGKPAAQAGFQVGDVISDIDGRHIGSFEKVNRIVATNVGRSLTFGIERDGTHKTLTVTPVEKVISDQFGRAMKRGEIGIGSTLPARVGKAIAGRPAAEAGFQAGDLIVEIDGRAIAGFEDLHRIVSESLGRTLTFTVDRGGQRIVLTATPVSADPSGKSGDGARRGMIGIQPEQPLPSKSGPIESIQLGIESTWFFAEVTLGYVWDVIVGRQKPDQLGGPLSIAYASGQSAKEGLEHVLWLIAVLSIGIGLLNLFPIPILDGGHLLFYAIEAVRGRPLSERTQEWAFRMGFVAILMLIGLVFYNDSVIALWWFKGNV